MTTPSTVTAQDMTTPLASAALTVERELRADDDLLQSPEVKAALQQLSQLAGQANEAARVADDHTAENPEAERDAQRAREAADIAVNGQAAIKSAARSGDRSAVTGAVQRSLGNARTAVTNAVDIAEDHEHATVGGSSERTAHGASIKAKEQAKEQSKKKISEPVAKKNKVRDHDDDEPTPQERARAKKEAAQKRHRGENDSNDEHDDEVGKGKTRRHRKATSTGGRKATRIIANGTMGLISEEAADEIVSTAGTGVQRMSEGAAGFTSGDVKKSDEGALATGRGVRNMLRDDLGVNGTVAQGLGRATTVTLQTAGRAGAAVANTADDARDLAADKYQMMWRYGRELNQLLGGLQGNAKTRAMYDTDKDGKVELHEVVNKLKTYGITDMKNIDFNGDGNITYAEIGAAIKSRGKPPGK